jgi:pimeloyl-ACP methyl ester carboxylesterase
MKQKYAFAPPSVFNTAREILAPFEWAGTLIQFPTLSLLPKGDGRPILLIPGYMTDEWSMRPLKVFLNKLGYEVYDWDHGRNLGKVDRYIDRVGKSLQRKTQGDQAKSPFTLIGWSLGGVIAREVARLFPEQVREVITMGSPITGGPKYTVVGQKYAKRERLDLDEFEKHVLERNQIGFEQPVTSIYSKTDGVVGWQAALDIYNAHARNIEVSATHLGIGVNAKVWRIIAAILAENEDDKPT